MPLSALNTVPPREVFDLATCPPQYRQAFRPRGNFGDASPLDQPRLVLDVDEADYPDEESACRLVRGMFVGIAIEAIAVAFVAGYVLARHIY